MFYLLCAIVSSSLIGIVMRLAQPRIQARISMLSANYLTCMICSFLMLENHAVYPAVEGMSRTFMLGILNGFFYVASLVLAQLNIERNGVVLQSVFSKMGDLLVPLLLAIVVFRERPTLLQAVGALLVIGAILLMNKGDEKSGKSSMKWLILLFIAEGAVGSMSKIYKEAGTLALRPQFLFYTFVMALILTGMMVIYRKEKPGLKELGFGICIGLPNFFSSLLLLKALESVPAVVAYPIRSVGAIVLVTLAGLTFFHEKLKNNQWLAMGIVLLAVVLLNI